MTPAQSPDERIIVANKTVYRCKQGLACSIKGQRYHFSGGDLVLEDHPVQPKGHANFEEISEYVERTSRPRRRGVVVEQTTAEPGEKRRIGRPASAKNKPKDSQAEPVTEKAAPKAQKEQVSDGQA